MSELAGAVFEGHLQARVRVSNRIHVFKGTTNHWAMVVVKSL